MSASPQSETGIAIIGMTGRFPKARDVDEFWRNLCDGVEGISFFTDAELEQAGVAIPKDNPHFVKARGILEGADMFDAAFFGINPKEAEVMDPQHRVFLECAWEALESAGYDSEKYGGSIGVFAGMSMNTYLAHNVLSRPDIVERLGEYQVMLGNDKDFLPTRVSYKLNLKGPSLNIQTACSTSLVAVCVACQNLLNYECDMALAGAVSISFPQKKGYFHQEGGIASPDGRCRAFDAKAAGTVAGEGAAIVVLKRLEDAKADGDQIYAVIKGFAINNDGSLKIGYTAPSVEGQAEVIATAQTMAGIAPETIGYVEAHGTGTPLGDPIEIQGLTKAFRRTATNNGFCAIGSVKSNIGHLDTAAGVAGLIKAALALHHKVLPPSLHFETPHPNIDFANSPFFVNATLAEWKPRETPRRAGVSSFGIGGTNAHVVLEEAPLAPPSSQSRPAQLILLSAKSPSALETATANLAEFLIKNPELNLADAAFILQTGRRAFPYRRMLVCRHVDDAAKALDNRDPRRLSTNMAEHENPPVIFMFPGQGAQHINMGLELYETEPVFRNEVARCCEILAPHLGLDLRALLYPPPEASEAAKQTLTQTVNAQAALFVTEYALAKLWLHWGVRPAAMIGHSVGEYVAACLAGVLSLQEALPLVAARGRLMQQLPGGSMLAVRLPERDVQPFLRGTLSLAAVNGPSLCVVSGETNAIARLQGELVDRGIASTLLQTSHAFHSAMMEPMLKPFAERVSKAQLKPPATPFVSNVTGTWITVEQAIDPTYWVRHARQTVRFADGLSELLQQPDNVFLEIGPGQTLCNLAKQNPARRASTAVLASLRRINDSSPDSDVLLAALGQLWLHGVRIDWRKFYEHEQRRRVRLPTYPFERKRFWIEPARRASLPA
ncbi:MAG: type I polyketide synthase, partial [Verrucomicrobiota bacterium]